MSNLEFLKSERVKEPAAAAELPAAERKIQERSQSECHRLFITLTLTLLKLAQPIVAAGSCSQVFVPLTLRGKARARSVSHHDHHHHHQHRFCALNTENELIKVES